MNNNKAFVLVVCSSGQSPGDTIRMICSSSEIVGDEIQLLPDGLVQSKKGEFLADSQARKEIISYFNSEKNDVVIDYEHQTLKDIEAPAGGWIKELIDKGKDGLWAKVEWTPRAKEYIANKEYRYFSPVVLVKKSDNRAAILHSGALTNKPAIDGMEPLINKDNSKEEYTMDFLKQLAALLGLSENATEAEILAAIKKLIESKENVALKHTLGLLSLKENATTKEIEAAVLALKNPAGMVPMESYTALANKTADLEGKLKAQQDKEIKDTVEVALKAGKITPAQKDWAVQYALKDPEGFKAFIEKAPVVVPLDPVKDKDDTATKTNLADTQVSINKMLGISDEDYKKFGGTENGSN